jgi:hypothetical protein
MSATGGSDDGGPTALKVEKWLLLALSGRPLGTSPSSPPLFLSTFSAPQASSTTPK